MMDEVSQQDFASVKERLDEIVEAVSSDDMELDQALGLYEEAIKLGMQASSLLEEDIVGTEEDQNSEEASDTSSEQDEQPIEDSNETTVIQNEEISNEA